MKDIKVILNEKRNFRAGHRHEVITIQGELKVRIKEAQEKGRKELEWNL